ncbi:MAG: GntR family transcriptional regulator, partial [Tissierellia bacterium]|nr:GntR family transcriptional regulator [Tissierellia bacterium]
MIERKKEKLSSDQIYTVLRERIIDLSYEPGTVLNEVDAAEEFGLSRTPVRVAFKRLEEDRLVNIIPRFGVQVVPIDFIQM